MKTKLLDCTWVQINTNMITVNVLKFRTLKIFIFPLFAILEITFQKSASARKFRMWSLHDY